MSAAHDHRRRVSEARYNWMLHHFEENKEEFEGLSGEDLEYAIMDSIGARGISLPWPKPTKEELLGEAATALKGCSHELLVELSEDLPLSILRDAFSSAIEAGKITKSALKSIVRSGDKRWWYDPELADEYEGDIEAFAGMIANERSLSQRK